jgi:hypothetical protein
MPFPHNGVNHHDGIKNEKNIVNYQNSNPKNEINEYFLRKHPEQKIEWEHKGGTKRSDDAVINYESGESDKVSIKNHKRGTFDWKNTTKLVPEDLKKDINEFKEKNKDIKITTTMRTECSDIFSKSFDNLTSETIATILNNIYQNYPDNIIVNDIKNKRYLLFNKSNLSPYFDIKKNNKFILKSSNRAKTSRQLWLKNNDGSETRTNLRIRMCLNNGISALFATNGCVPSIKIQQDNVDQFIDKCNDKIIVYY